MSINGDEVERKIEELPEVKLEGSLEFCRTTLRESYINFKD